VNTSPTIGAIATAIAKAQKVIKPAAFDRTNPHFKNKYATLPAIMEAIRVPFADNGIALLQGAEADGATVKVTMRLAHTSGEWIESTLTMTAQQNTPQGIMAALTYCRRGALSLVCAVSDDDDDGEAASRPPHREEPPPPKPKPVPVEGVPAIWHHLVEACKGNKAQAQERLEAAAYAHFGKKVATADWTEADCVKVNFLLFPEADAP
jgi:hypothetical protein